MFIPQARFAALWQRVLKKPRFASLFFRLEKLGATIAWIASSVEKREESDTTFFY